MIEKGSARHDLRLLGGVPTITPQCGQRLQPVLINDAWHWDIAFIGMKGELDVNFAGIYSKYCHAEQLWNVTAEAGKRRWYGTGQALHGHHPATAKNLYVVDGTTPGALGFGYATRDWEGFMVASTKASEPKFYRSATGHTDGFSGDPEELLGLKTGLFFLYEE